jgi:mono/diheme cytochrome c family protein
MKLWPILLLLIPFALTGCDSTMQRQNKAKDNGATNAWPSGQTARPLPAGVVAEGDGALRSEQNTPPKVTMALLQRGRERYDIFCSVCHGFEGNGDGPVVQRGFPRPISFNGPARRLPAISLYLAISNGVGKMLSMRAQVPSRDRWAIVAYVRALQLSQHAKVADIPDLRKELP